MLEKAPVFRSNDRPAKRGSYALERYGHRVPLVAPEDGS